MENCTVSKGVIKIKRVSAGLPVFWMKKYYISEGFDLRHSSNFCYEIILLHIIKPKYQYALTSHHNSNMTS